MGHLNVAHDSELHISHEENRRGFSLSRTRFRSCRGQSIAYKIKAVLINDAKQSRLTASRRSMRLAELSQHFLQWASDTQLEPKSKEHCRGGWRKLLQSRACGSPTLLSTTRELFVLLIRQPIPTVPCVHCGECWGTRQNGG